jgi:hypothetical protein
MNAWSIVLFGVIGILLAMALVVFIPKTCAVARVEEGFQQDTIKTCPRGSTMFTDTAGNINCCRGDVTGTRCDGKVVCTFSSDTSKYPMCNASKLKRQYTGEIPQWLNTWADNTVDPLFKVINLMRDFLPTINKIPNTTLPDSVKKSYLDLMNEEKQRVQEIYGAFGPNTKNPNFDWNLWRKNEAIDLAQYQKEDIMYIINKLTSMMAQAPKLQSSPIVQQQIKAQICK